MIEGMDGFVPGHRRPDLTTLALDTTSLLLSGANLVTGWTGVASAVLTPLGMAQTLAFDPAYDGAPILRE